MDSWFSAPALVSKAAELFPVITMVKKTSKIHYLLDTVAAQLEGKGMPAEITEPIFQAIIAQVLQQMNFIPIKQEVQYANAG